MPDASYVLQLTVRPRRGWVPLLGVSVVALIVAVVIPRYQPVADSDEAILSDADGLGGASHAPKELSATPPVVERLVEISTAWVASCDVAHHRAPHPLFIGRASLPRAPPGALA